MPTPTTISFSNQNCVDSSSASTSSAMGNGARIRVSLRTDSASESTNRDMDEITQKMGKLWYPTSVQDLSHQFERNKHGLLERNGNENSSHSDVSAKQCYADWYDKIISKSEEAEVYGQHDRKLEKSVGFIKNINKFWAKELYDMDVAERELIENEMHGIKTNRTIEETSKSVQDAIVAFRAYLKTNLDKELDNRDSIVPPVTKDPYRKAVYELKSDYVTSKAFLIKFLRACHYNFEDAALRYFRYLDLLLLLFGEVALTRPLEMNDLTKREMRYLKKGQMQLFSLRDRAGRRIFAFSGCEELGFNIREKYRVNTYLVEVMSDDVTTQKLGAVTVNAPRVRYDVGDNPFGFEGFTLRAGKQDLLGGKCTEAQFFRKCNEAMPLRLSGIHYFAPSTIIYDIGRSLILSLLGKDHRKIVRFHGGSHMECEYILRSFGIPNEALTITDGDNIKNKNVPKFINARRSIELFRQQQREQKAISQEQPESAPFSFDDLEECPVIECPEVNCVVFGDKSLYSLPANVEFRDLLKVMEQQREEGDELYGELIPMNQFVETIIEKARLYNWRFLVFDKNSSLFVEIQDHNELCKRISQSLRDQRKRSKHVTNGQGQSASDEDVLDEAGASIMSLGATKRLKRSYEKECNVAQYLFCSDKDGSQHN